jgi:tol-pal system protein YbgF
MKSRAISITRSRQTDPVRDIPVLHGPILHGLVALLTGLACLAAAFAAPPAAFGQVLSSQPYVPAPDPAVEALRRRIIELEGQVKQANDRSERLGFDLAEVRRTADQARAAQQKAEETVSQLLLRMEALETRAVSAPAGAGGSAAAEGGPVSTLATAQVTGATVVAGAETVDISTLPQDEEGLYREARNLLLDGKYANANAGFGVFLSKYPKSKNAHEAQYMLADSLLYQKRYGEAITAYEKVLSDYPNSSNGPNALAKLARSLTLMNQKTKACTLLALMPKQFPKASAQAKALAQTERDRASCK